MVGSNHSHLLIAQEVGPDTEIFHLLAVIVTTRDYFDATASNWNTSAHRAPWRVSLYKDRQSNWRVGVF